MSQSVSDSDIPQMISSDPLDDIHITTRHASKRPRLNPATATPVTELQDFKREIRDMLDNWRADQEVYFTKLCNDQCSSLNKLVADMAELKRQNLAIQKSNTEIEKSISFISERYDDLLKQVESLQRENLTYKNSILSMETKIQDLQRVSRPSTIEIRNVPYTQNETVSDLTAIVTKRGQPCGVDEELESRVTVLCSGVEHSDYTYSEWWRPPTAFNDTRDNASKLLIHSRMFDGTPPLPSPPYIHKRLNVK
ncbi:hypothetical protein PYW07_014133 [Mythimna separata]|uniref:Uncharacterized protein n=1 Tax=Mythimna separata TaxID=271217 RepID=A0AAD8DPI7_MYTSE|nr:hypothetical protein PYW07_014133 [Mythimna separata]